MSYVATVSYSLSPEISLLQSKDKTHLFHDPDEAKNTIRQEILRRVNDAGLEDHPVSDLDELRALGWFITERVKPRSA